MNSEKLLNLNDLDDEVKLIDIANQLSDYDEEELKQLCAALTDESLAMVLVQADEDDQKRVISLLTNKRIIKVFSYMQTDDIVDILGILKVGKTKELMNLMNENDKKVVKELLGYKDDSAGGIMTTEYIAMRETLTVKDALAKIKAISPKTELLDTIFITDQNKKLIGTCELRDILSSELDVSLEELTNKNFVSVPPEMDQEEVARIASKYDLNVIPVVNKKNGLIGIITIDDIVDVIVEEQTEDALQIGGVDKEETIDSTVGESVRFRLPWLLVNLITAFLASFTVKAFESTIAQVVALSSIMSIVTGMGGNAGTQTVSIIVRNIAMGTVELKDGLKLLKKEFLTGLINGIFIGLITGVIIALVYKNAYLGLIIFLAMIGNLVIANVCGVLIPLILKKLKLDPAISSTVFLTTATDVLGFFIFLSLAKIFLPHLI
jgi:magnesium transporter